MMITCLVMAEKKLDQVEVEFGEENEDEDEDE